MPVNALRSTSALCTYMYRTEYVHVQLMALPAVRYIACGNGLGSRVWYSTVVVSHVPEGFLYGSKRPLPSAASSVTRCWGGHVVHGPEPRGMWSWVALAARVGRSVQLAAGPVGSKQLQRQLGTGRKEQEGGNGGRCSIRYSNCRGGGRRGIACGEWIGTSLKSAGLLCLVGCGVRSRPCADVRVVYGQQGAGRRKQ